MLAIFAGGSVTYLVGHALILIYGPPVKPAVVVRSLLILLGGLVLAAANFELDIIPQKLASEEAFTVWQESDWSGLPNFVGQAALNIPAFSLTNVWWAAIGTNVALLALTYLVAASKDNASAVWLLTPAVINFSIFALRDPLIGISMFVFTVLAMKPRSLARVVGLLFACVGAYFTRPENLVIFGAALALIEVRRSKRTMLLPFAVPAIGVGAFAALSFAPRLLIGSRSVQSVSDVPLLLENFYRGRAERHGGDAGVGSNILGGRLSSLGFVVRYPIQLVSFIILPLPFEIRSVTMLIAFADSLFLFWLLRRYWKEIPREGLVIAIVFVLFNAMFSSNYGNSYRLRLPLYYIIAASIFARDSSRDDSDEPAESGAVGQSSSGDPAQHDLVTRRAES